MSISHTIKYEVEVSRKVVTTLFTEIGKLKERQEHYALGAYITLEYYNQVSSNHEAHDLQVPLTIGLIE